MAARAALRMARLLAERDTRDAGARRGPAARSFLQSGHAFKSWRGPPPASAHAPSAPRPIVKRVSIAWHPAEERFVGTGAEGMPVAVNAPHADPAAHRTGMSPADLLLVAAGTSAAWDVVEILRKQRQAVEAVDVDVSGEQDREPPWTFRDIRLAFTVRGRGIPPELVEQAVRLSEERHCSVTATIRQGATVTHSVNVLKSEDGPAT